MPYALVMGATNEWLRHRLRPDGHNTTTTYMLSGAGAGMIAAAVTNPLDVAKTRLQTQHWGEQPPAGAQPQASAAPSAAGGVVNAGPVRGGGASGAVLRATVAADSATLGVPRKLSPTLVRHLPTSASTEQACCTQPKRMYTGLAQTLRLVHAEEGIWAFARGLGPRVLYHAPSVAISWTTYETVKSALIRIQAS
eukprot:CAMPEP_0119432854 /NCGR_PEP_ID=MMETSP1335-20130426/48593_1 /TAXON_ID=259385 /ORGANISM="Chrysoculter rhomboideus, Strain RCC1486" /LENGTH=194 /DNA_ID=CAMNT_0007458691 /DNA_START=1 /DNA_END=585 /DNA_ORIENTATION=+